MRIVAAIVRPHRQHVLISETATVDILGQESGQEKTCIGAKEVVILRDEVAGMACQLSAVAEDSIDQSRGILSSEGVGLWNLAAISNDSGQGIVGQAPPIECPESFRENSS